MTGIVSYTLSTAAPWFLMIVGLILTALVDPYINRRNRRLMLLIDALVLVLIAVEIAEYIIFQTAPRDLLRTCVSALGYSVRPFLLALTLLLIFPERAKWYHWALAGASAAVYALSVPTGIAFRIVDNRFYRGPLAYACHVVSALLIVDLTVQMVRASRRERKNETVLILFALALIIAGAVADAFQAQLLPFNHLTKGLIGSIFFYFIWLHIQLSRRHERESLEALRAEHRIQLMVSQIQPHFLYNTLSTIQALCRTEPEKAFDLTEHFGRYLRQNLDSLNQTAPIPFEQEMAHTRVYAEIETVRFPSIQITYDLQDVDFSVPVLTVQPLVENAIRHGVRIRENGEIVVASRREDDAHVVRIRDNGTGFDAQAALVAEGGHIGLKNVKARVEQMCAGTMAIDSRIGEGTTITLRFPAGGARK